MNAAMLPLATLLRVNPWTAAVRARSGSTAHLLLDGPRPACGRRPRATARVDVEQGPALRVCASCVAALPDLTRMHLATLGRPTTAELAAVREAEALAIAADARDRLEALRDEAVLEGSVSERVVFDGDPPPAHDYGGHRGDDVVLTVGLMIGSLIPGAMTGGRLWLPGTADAPARVSACGSAADDVVLSPHGPAQRRASPGGQRYGARPVAR